MVIAYSKLLLNLKFYDLHQSEESMGFLGKNKQTTTENIFIGLFFWRLLAHSKVLIISE